MGDAAALHRRMVDELDLAGCLTVGWHEAFRTVRRHRFVPDTVWLRDAGISGRHDLVPLRRADQPQRWLELAYADDAVITQVDDGVPSGPNDTGYAVSSSASQPSVMALMLAAADIEPGMTVCEIGTGTGYNAALLAARLGARNVTTIEVDPRLAGRARRLLNEHQHGITVVTGDGATGYPHNAPYDRVLATCAVQRVPYQWVAQTRPDGRIVTPWGTPFHNNGLLRLTVTGDGVAHGTLVDTAGFMWLRDQRIPRATIRECVYDEDAATVSHTDLNPYDVIGDHHAATAVGLRVPACKQVYCPATDGSGEFTSWLLDQASRSWASIDYQPGHAEYRVQQLGPRLLWNEVAQAYRGWCDAGRPTADRWRFVIAAQGQRVSL